MNGRLPIRGEHRKRGGKGKEASRWRTIVRFSGMEGGRKSYFTHREPVKRVASATGLSMRNVNRAGDRAAIRRTACRPPTTLDLGSVAGGPE